MTPWTKGGNLEFDPLSAGILLVDDDPTYIKFTTMILRDFGYKNIFTAENGTKALSLLAAHGEEIYAVMLDLHMPEMHGLDVIRHLLNVQKVPVGITIVTGFPDMLPIRDFYGMGTDTVLTVDYVLKPFDSEFFIGEVKKTIAAVSQKRKQLRTAGYEDLHNRLDKIEAGINSIAKHQRGFLVELGLDVIRALIIALALVAFLLLGVSDFVKAIFAKLGIN